MPTVAAKPAAKNATKPTSKGKGKKKATERPLVYAVPTAEFCYGDKALRYDRAVELMGWHHAEDEAESEEWGDDYLLLDEEGRKVRCDNNYNNRPFTLSQALSVKQEQLNRRWAENGESMIFGVSGATLSAQHRLAGFILAVQAWRAAPPGTYEAWGADEPTFPCLLVFGISEDDRTVNTIDCGKRRSLADVVYRSELFSGMPPGDRKKAGKTTESAVRMLWHRTGAKANAFTAYQTHAESYEFIVRHKRLVEAVKHVLELNGGKDRKLEFYLTPGYAAAMLYLMGMSATDEDAYKEGRSEEVGDDSRFEDAKEYWTLLAATDKKVKGVAAAIDELAHDNLTHWELRVAAVCKGFDLFLQGTPITSEKVMPLLEKNREGVSVLASMPYLGGMDIGPIDDAQYAGGEEGEDAEPTEEEIEAAKEEERKAALRKKAADNGKAQHEKHGKAIGETEHCYVIEKNGGHWPCIVHEIDMTKKGKGGHRMARVKVAPGMPQAGTIYEVKYEQLSRHLPAEE
jgi:hypothetical protein